MPVTSKARDGPTPWQWRSNVRDLSQERLPSPSSSLLWLHSPQQLLRWPLGMDDLWPFGAGGAKQPPAVRINALSRLALLAGLAGTAVWGRTALYGAVAMATTLALMQDSAEQRWRTLSERPDAPEDDVLAQMRQETARALAERAPADLAAHSLNQVNPNPFQHDGANFCGDPPVDTSAAPSVDERTYTTGEADLGLFVNQLPDPTGCARSPFFDDLPPEDPVGSERRCAYRRCM